MDTEEEVGNNADDNAGIGAGPAPDAAPAVENNEQNAIQDEPNLGEDEIVEYVSLEENVLFDHDQYFDFADHEYHLPLGVIRPIRDTFSDVEDSDESVEPDAENRTNDIIFDMDLPAEHSYLGNNMDRVPGVEYLETGRVHRLMLFLHRHIVYPGELLPFIIPGFIIDGDIDTNNGLLFGLAFEHVRCPRSHAMYGVTCQIYEKGTDERGNTLIKSRALQRFVTTNDTRREHLEYISSGPHLKTFGHVKILPEIYLPEPLSTINLGSMNRFRDIPGMERYLKDFQATTTIWPKHVFKQYNINNVLEKVLKSLEGNKIGAMPSDPIRLSFWLSRNSHFSEEQLNSIFTTDSVHARMKIIADSFNDDGGLFVCRFCRNQIAHSRELFPMSKYGMRSQYCNSAGYIHEINTVYKVLDNAVTLSGNPSTEFSWFPGYEWHIIVCRTCNRHIGWQFRASEANLTPVGFYGLTAASVRIDKENKSGVMPGRPLAHVLEFHSYS